MRSTPPRTSAPTSRTRAISSICWHGSASAASPAAQILHTAELLFHDHVPAQRCGLATCWIHRRAGQDGFGATRAPEGEVRPDFRFESLAAMADAHRAEQTR